MVHSSPAGLTDISTNRRVDGIAPVCPRGAVPVLLHFL
jgi:hypothetical protein